MATIELKKVEKRFGNFQAVQPMDLTINDGEFVVLLGPSGCGKTTTLRMISGLESVSGGNILVGGQDVTWHHPSDRDIAFVFQLYALYPHISVQKNITFPLEAQKESKQVIQQRLMEVVELLQIQHLLNRRPHTLSGGDQQRVALARALVRRPEAFLMDEPIGALDADFRETMRAEIKRLHITQGATTVYVTHDQIEAMAMGDRIVVMSDAVVQQVGTPYEVYYDPANIFVARFIGSPGMNLITGRYEDGILYLPGDNAYKVPERWMKPLANYPRGDKFTLGFRPEGAVLEENGQINAEVYASDLHGAYMMLHMALDPDTPETLIHARAGRGGHHAIGENIQFDIDPAMVRFFDHETGKALLPEENNG
ncbi:MAG TPA: ABC transporter ATP-binding protein [candidate division Zixibacteria bacterium]|nr:ABC transporter ATP-binding protein [candidate division Zixibacteria bacterium]